MWLFGIMENLLTDPVFAGRLVSVFAGLLTLFGIYKLTKYVSDKKTAMLASLFYIFIPLFSFYDRQALMESAVSAVGIWSCYFLVKGIKEQKYLDFIFLGITLGLGYFIKSTPIIFLIASLFLIFVFGIKHKEKQKIFEGFTISVFSFIAVVFLLIINPQFWQTLSSNSRFTFSLSELLGFPISIWISNLITNFRISFFYITPIIFLSGICGILLIIKSRDKTKQIIALFFLISVIFETLVIRGTVDRYLVAFLPLFPVFSSLYITYLIGKRQTKKIALALIFFVVITSLPLTLLQIVNQVVYFRFYGNISGVTYYNYLNTNTAGYGLDKVYSYLNNISKNKKIIVGVAENTGNPESAMIVHYGKSLNVRVIYFDSRLLSPQILNYDCLETGMPTYFVSRQSELVGLDKFFVNLKFIQNPYGKNITGIYTLKSNCKGNTGSVYLQQN